MSEHVVLDTSVILSDFNSIRAFPKKNVVIPMVVLREIDKHKNRKDEVGINAREANRILDSLKGDFEKGILLENKSKIIIMNNDQDPSILPDDRIISTAKELLEKNKKVILVSQDLNLRVRARVAKIKSEPYHESIANLKNGDEIYSGAKEIIVPQETIDNFHKNKHVKIEDKTLFPNQFVTLISEIDPKHTGLGIYMNDVIKKFEEIKSIYTVKPKNREQQCALQLLMNKDIDFVSLLGTSGSGKTLMAVATGLDQVDKGLYDRVVVVKPIVPVGRDLGFLPGQEQDKIAPYMASVDDALRHLCGADIEVENVKMSGKIEYIPLAFLRGRNLTRAYIIIEECQNTMKVEAKTIVTRSAEGSKVVITADIDQIDNNYVDILTNGATHCIESLKDDPYTGHITFVQGERSRLASLAARKL